MTTTEGRWTMKVVGAASLAFVLATPMFAQSRDSFRGNESSRGRTQTSERSQSSRNDRASTYGYRENQRVEADGRVSSFTPERDGYRVQLEGRRDSYYVPRSQFGRGHDLRVGLEVRLGGIFRGSTIYVDAVHWPDQRGYDRAAYVTGIVDRVDARSETVWLRTGGRLLAVDMRNATRGSRDLRQLRRGDSISLSGEWQRGGTFEAYRIEDLRDRR
jgi:hypothetical protein